ncbi:MAG: shikimate kinase [Dehalococcoidales bacterium]|nr:shikimate kinase [Dehalococcoidales bacterium]
MTVSDNPCGDSVNKDMKTNIALIGFMGTGKSTVGRAVAKKLQRKFIELDKIVVQRAGKSIPDIFQQDGEITFRELEIQATKDIAREKRMVIACGGGIVLNNINIDRLRKDAVIIYLTATPGVIMKRISHDKNVRPLLNVADPALRIKELLKFRRPFYERAADIKINTSKLDIDAVAKQIIDRLKKDESFDI